jgi:hypothetical protein
MKQYNFLQTFLSPALLTGQTGDAFQHPSQGLNRFGAIPQNALNVIPNGRYAEGKLLPGGY